MTLRLSGAEPDSVFALLGKDENSVTFSLGWAMRKSPVFFRMLLADLIGQKPNDKCDYVIDLQKHHVEGGFTDIEVVCHDFCHILIEAKVGWSLPGVPQLQKYSPRLVSKGQKRIISISAATQDYASRILPKKIGAIPVAHRSWADIKSVVLAAYRAVGSFEEKLWLREFDRHLEEYVSMRNPRDNQVFVVALKKQSMDVAEKDARYWHPVGKRYPVLPPNYVGFRYRGALQSVHHIDAYEVVADLSKRNRKWPVTEVDHFLYTLGPAMKPAKEIRAGKIFGPGHVLCAIDTLLSGAYKTVSDARNETKRRMKSEGKRAI